MDGDIVERGGLRRWGTFVLRATLCRARVTELPKLIFFTRLLSMASFLHPCSKRRCRCRCTHTDDSLACTGDGVPSDDISAQAASKVNTLLSSVRANGSWQHVVQPAHDSSVIKNDVINIVGHAPLAPRVCSMTFIEVSPCPSSPTPFLISLLLLLLLRASAIDFALFQFNRDS